MGFEPTSSSPQTPLNVKLETARNNIIATQQKNKTIVNNKRKPCDLTIGDKVLYEYPPLAMEKGAKLNFRYTGPFTIVDKLSQNNYRIHSNEGRYRNFVVNATQIKKYYDRSEFITCSLSTLTETPNMETKTNSQTNNSFITLFKSFFHKPRDRK